MKAVIEYDGSKEMKDKANEKEKLPKLDMTKYGAKEIRRFYIRPTVYCHIYNGFKHSNEWK